MPKPPGATDHLQSMPSKPLHAHRPKAGATLSPCRRYRYTLERSWDHALPTVMFIALNPSTADESTDDPTLRRCIRFARDLGYARLILTNLFALRSTDPRALLTAADPIGPDNDRHILDSARRADLIIACWGNRGGYLGRDARITNMIPELHCLGLTKAGAPRHPLYLPASATPMHYQPPAPI